MHFSQYSRFGQLIMGPNFGLKDVGRKVINTRLVKEKKKTQI